MSDKHEDANLILRLYELRREEVMRKARDWFTIGFNPQSTEDVVAAAMGEHSAYYRMVTTYWDMAASFVNHGAIDEQMFHDANGEHLVVYAKLEPFIEQIRAASGSPKYLQHLERLVRRMPDSEEQMKALRERIRQWAAMRAEAASKAQAGA
jgi:hypothetical protein